METQQEKTDKRTKEYKTQSNDTMAKIQALIDMGIPLRRVVFYDTVLSLGGSPAGEPENALYSLGETQKKSRTAELWLCPNVLVVRQKGEYKLIPSTAVKDSNVLLK